MTVQEKILRSGCSGIFSDLLDKLGYRDQVVSGMKCNSPTGRLYGPVRTVLLRTLETDDENIRTGLGFIGKMNKGEILCVQGSHEFAYFGELMTRLSTRQGLGGVIIDGLTRDTFYTHDGTQSLTIFAQGYSPKDIKGRGRVESTDVSIQIGHKEVRPGDYLFGDNDGLVVIPAIIVSEVEKQAAAMIDNEEGIKADIRAGLSVDGILEKYKEF